MPIRFRCTHCSRLLGIARRKAGTQTTCPRCNQPVMVPLEDDLTLLQDLDELLNSAPRANGSAVGHLESAPASTVATGSAMDLPSPEAPAVAMPPAPSPPRPQRARRPEDEPLLVDDVDELLGIAGAGEKLEFDEAPSPKAKPVSGMDANSLDDGSGKIVLSPQKATLLVIAVVVLIGVAFSAGFLIASRLG